MILSIISLDKNYYRIFEMLNILVDKAIQRSLNDTQSS